MGLRIIAPAAPIFRLRFARQRVAECVGCGEISFQGLDGIDSQDGLQVSLVRRPSVWMRNKSPVK
jgi:hypothetical protein